MPALESAHALAHAKVLAPTMRPDQHIVVNLSGRGDKDIMTVANIDGIEIQGPLLRTSMNRIDQRFSELKQQGRKALIPYITAGDPARHSPALCMRW